jgi:hypothetical protein
MKLGLHISHLLPLNGLAAQPMAFCVYSDINDERQNKWTHPGSRGMV